MEALLRRLIFPALVGLAAYYAVFGGEYSVFDLNRIRGDVQEARIVVEQLGDATRALAPRVEALEHDLRTLETLARESFGMIREGEILYRFADSGEPDEPSP
jgi:cell division protein FtsB